MIMHAARILLLIGLGIASAASHAAAQGVVLPGMGPVNRSMAGAAAGAPLDAAGAMHWNPATISGLEQNEIMFGAEFLFVRTDVTSSIPGLGDGSTVSESGTAVLPAMAIVYQPEDVPWTLGFGVFTIGGFSANYPADPTNPIFSPPPPFGAGVGAVFSELALIQYVPTASLWLTDRLAVGVAPTFTMASLSVDPGFFAFPDDANGDMIPSYPAATHSRFHWGLGFQVGVYYETEGPLSFGVSFKSPVWFEDFTFNATDEIGAPRPLAIDVDYPMILSGGIGVRPWEELLWATDVRYIDYEHTPGFGDPAAFAPDLSVTGLGWKSVVSVATGLHYEWSPATSTRIGYLFCENPIPAESAFFNIASPPIYQHAIFLGASQRLTNSIGVSLSYLHAFENSIVGPYVPVPIPGATVGINQGTDALTGAVQVFF
jgi:long-chain fatty acid transport protein